ncbi:hypothetical protein [Cereibacter ovatus]|uniref:hypothetical protein n=1 Tax=Cereibacter ovatus TaxID=439529 RepID=UPI0011425557|nr:hypothetical protein [Cereibacter ovatus]
MLLPLIFATILLGEATALAAPKEELLHAESVCNGMTQIKGICWKLTPSQMIGVLESRGYECEKFNFDRAMILGLSYVCSSGNSTVEMSLDATKLTYSCENFKACGYSVKELGQSIVDKGIVSGLEASYESRLDWGLGENVNKFALCGRGKNDEKVCVVEMDVFGNSQPLISFSKGSGGIDLE